MHSMSLQWVVDRMKQLLSWSRMLLRKVNGYAWRTYIWLLHGFQVWKKKSRCLHQIRSSGCGWPVSLTQSSLRSCCSRAWKLPMKLHLVWGITCKEHSTMSLHLKKHSNRFLSSHNFSSSSHGSMHSSKKEESTFLKAGLSIMSSHLVILKLVNLPSRQYSRSSREVVLNGRRSMVYSRMPFMEAESIMILTWEFSEPIWATSSPIRRWKARICYLTSSQYPNLNRLGPM